MHEAMTEEEKSVAEDLANLNPEEVKKLVK